MNLNPKDERLKANKISSRLIKWYVSLKCLKYIVCSQNIISYALEDLILNLI